MRSKHITDLLTSVAFVALAVFLACILFIKPAFLDPVTEWVHNLGVITIGTASFSVGGTIAIVLFFGFIIPTAYGFRKKKSAK
jgi:hypothetical protein